MARARGVAGAFAAAVVVLWTAGVAGCGPGKGSGSGTEPPGGSGPPPGDTGGGGGTAGTTGPAGGSSGGSTSGGTAAGGSAGGGTSGGTSGAASGGTDAAGGGAPAGGSGAGGSSGGGTSGGAAANPCDGLVPTPDLGHVVQRGGNCTHSNSRTDGQIALGYVGNQGLWWFDLYSPDGSAAQGTITKVLGIGPLVDADAWFHATGPGWAGIVHDVDHLPPAQALRSWDTAGHELGTAADFAVTSAPDGHGGTVMLAHPVGLGPFASTPTLLEWLDGSSRLLRAVTLDADPSILLVDWNTDHVLTIIPGVHGGRASARWFDGAGTPLTPWFDAGPAVSAVRLHLLVDGSIALSADATWTAVFRDGVASIDAPPPWLAARPGTRLATIRGGRAYAVVPLPAPGGAPAPDAWTLEIVTPSGDSCGKVHLPPPDAAGGAPTSATTLDVGQDGTVFVTWPVATPAGSTGAYCAWRWWPGLLR